MTKKGEGVVGAIRSSQDLAGKVSKTYRYVRRRLEGDGSESDKHDPIISYRQGHGQRDG